MSIMRITFGLALAVLLASTTASTATKWAYLLDPAFSGNGYDTQSGDSA